MTETPSNKRACRPNPLSTKAMVKASVFPGSHGQHMLHGPHLVRCHREWIDWKSNQSWSNGLHQGPEILGDVFLANECYLTSSFTNSISYDYSTNAYEDAALKPEMKKVLEFTKMITSNNLINIELKATTTPPLFVNFFFFYNSDNNGRVKRVVPYGRRHERKKF